MAGKKGMHALTYGDPMLRERMLDKIRASQILQRIVKYVETGEGLDSSRAGIALGLLRKVLPDLSSSELEIPMANTVLRKARMIDITPKPESLASPSSESTTYKTEVGPYTTVPFLHGTSLDRPLVDQLDHTDGLSQIAEIGPPNGFSNTEK